MNFTNILVAVGSLLIGAGVGIFIIGQRRFDEKSILARADKLLSDAKRDSSAIVNKSHESAIEKKKQFEIDQKDFGSQIETMEKMYQTKFTSFQKREARLNDVQKTLKEAQHEIEQKKQDVIGVKKELNERLLSATGQSYATVKEDRIKYYEQVFKEDSETRLQRAIEWAQECATRDSRSILSDGIYRYSEGTTIEQVENTLEVPRDEIKGKIVGRGGQNIGLFEELFGVDVIFNDEPNTIIVSCFNLVQQEIARIALKKLMHEKTINDEVIRRAKTFAEQEMKKILRREGQRALAILGVKDSPIELEELVGRLKYRTSYGQNVMRHCFEVGYFSKLIAEEVGADATVALLAGFFHDVGKAIDQEVGGSHDVLSKEILEKFGFSWEITHAAWTHHNAIPQETIEARIVQAGDAISASRPGARAESMERYLTKIKDLQETALSFPGTKKVYAINAGREVRVVVDQEKVNDQRNQELATDIAAKVQEKGGYPGRIKIVTIRTTKVTDYVR